MLKFQNYARTLLRSSWAQHARSFSSPIPDHSSSIFVYKQSGRGFIDPNTIQDHFQSFGRILKINSGQYLGTALTFASPQNVQKLLASATSDGEVTAGGQIYRIKMMTLSSERPSTYINVAVFKKNVQDTDIHNAFSTFGPIKKVFKWKESPAVGTLSYMAQFVIQFENTDDAVNANWTLVTLNGAVLQTRMGLPKEEIPNKVLRFLIEPPWNRVQPDYSREAFVEDLSRRANVPLEELDCLFSYDLKRRVNKLLLRTKSIEAAEKIKAIPSSEIPNVTFSVRYYRPSSRVTHWAPGARISRSRS
ncbi:hypothetical protein C8J56DRAFT_924073 [Mycena floridula]|nr:hypothetical protein C8J56DRAFT_924073 [Mycena floridula]